MLPQKPFPIQWYCVLDCGIVERVFGMCEDWCSVMVFLMYK